jgi:hypothetical protein
VNGGCEVAIASSVGVESNLDHTDAAPICFGERLPVLLGLGAGECEPEFASFGYPSGSGRVF